MRVCYFGTYNKDYPRNQVIRKGLKLNGVEVIECRVDYSRVLSRHLKLIIKFLREVKNYDAIIVGETGYINVPLARFLTLFSKKPVILDGFFSWYDTLVFDRKRVKRDSFKAKKLHFEDKYGCRLANTVLLDTNEHIKYFKEEFGLEEVKFKRVFVGADDSIFYPRKKNKLNNNLLILFYGTYIPLHGIEYIVKTAKLLKTYNDIRFKIIGEGETSKEVQELYSQMNINNISFLSSIDLQKLIEFIADADILLGIFGDTPKAKRVIPHKVYQALAMQKPVITGDSLAAREIFKDRKNAILCEMANPEDLAKKILLLKEDKALREKIAKGGYELFKQKFTPEIIGKEIKEIILNRA